MHLLLELFETSSICLSYHMDLVLICNSTLLLHLLPIVEEQEWEVH